MRDYLFFRLLNQCLIALCLIGLTGAVTIAGQAHSFAISVTITGVEPGRGQVLASLYGSPAQFMKESTAVALAAVEQAGHVVLDFQQQPPGDYAIAVFYDVDNDGELDTNFFGLPKEAIGFSNNAKGRFGPPDWQDAHFMLAHDLEMTIMLRSVQE